MASPPIYPKQEKALSTLRGLCHACEKISADYHSWFWPLSRDEAMSRITARVNEITRVIAKPRNKITETSWDVILAEQAVLRAYISIVNPGIEKNALQNLLDPLIAPLAPGGPPWSQFIDSLNSLNTPDRAFPFVEGLQTIPEALKAKPQAKPKPVSLWASLLSLIESIKGWFQKKPAIDEVCDTVIQAPPPLEETVEVPSAVYVRSPREPGETPKERQARLAAKKKYKN